MSLYKYASVEINLHKELRVINRQTYGLLDWLGDCGGLLDALFFIGEGLMQPLAAFAVQSKLVSMIISYLPSNDKEILKT